ncbi:MAG: GTPase domain-containing protein [Verrucomicrobiaceae bacterium]|nr:GTPase domain-containing protein [Verrucomicrobiaceae bacterium]
MPVATVPAPDTQTVTLSLVSHTNAGKTTLARTLLRRDVGEVRDAPHVTVFNEEHTLIETGGAVLQLWDTPGFGDTARLLKRLKRFDKPLLWFLVQTWDRFTDKPLWCSQQALKNVREEADVVLYLVNAAESPEGAGYVAQEMEILSWVGKPVLALLNQTGPPHEPHVEAAELKLWKDHLTKHPVVRDVLNFDAFARCWVQEDVLLDSIGAMLSKEKATAFGEIKEAWHEQNVAVFEQSVKLLAVQLTSSVLDGVEVRAETLIERMGIGRGDINREYTDARQKLATKLAERLEHTTNELIALHGLEGSAERRMQEVAKEHFHQPQQVSESIWGVVASFAGGAMGGLIADLKLGGMTFGGGALLGGLASGLGAYALIRTYNLVRADDGRLHWSREHFREQVRLVLLCYLAVAHFGRGRGEWRDGVQPAHWHEACAKVIETFADAVDQVWKHSVEKQARPEVIVREMEHLVHDCARELLKRLYPREVRWS